MTAEIEIDASDGEGGGQILRSSPGLSSMTGKSFVIRNIRSGRSKPGLKRQHLTAVIAAARIGCAQVEGASPGSPEILFRPTGNFSGTCNFDVETSGSATPVLQTVLPALISADGPSRVTVEGGTHNPWPPPIVFFQRSFLPQLCRMVPQVTIEL